MTHCKCKEIEKLEKRLEQHEHLITQLVEVIAATNQRLINLAEHKTKPQKLYSSV